MGRTYAGILGPLAFSTVIARCLVHGGHAESALPAASLALFAFAAVGYIIGNLAERTIVEAIETRFRAQWHVGDLAHRPGGLTEPPATRTDAPA